MMRPHILLTLAASLVLAVALSTPTSAADDMGPHGVVYVVKLKTGGTLSGVVRGKGLYERRVKGVYVEAQKGDEDAGIRLWYPSNQNGYLFVGNSHIAQVSRQGAVTADDSKRLRGIERRARLRADAERKKLRESQEEAATEKQAATQQAATEKAASEEEAKEVSEADKLADFTALLLKYPPGRWTPGTPAEIKHRHVILGLAPTKEETEFLVIFDEWKAAYDLWKKARRPAQTADEKSSEG